MFIIWSKGRMKLSKSKLFFSVLVLAILTFFHLRGSVIGDEGYILNSSLKLINGSVPYRDFTFIYTPGSLFITALSFLILSPSILTSRILMIAISAFTSFIIFKVSFKITKNTIYSILAVFIFLAWGPSHINFAWPIMFVIPLSFSLLYLLLVYYEGKKGFLRNIWNYHLL